MSDELNKLLEIAPEKPGAPESGPRITLLARACQVLAALAVVSAAISFIPGKPSGPIGLTAPFVLSILGLFLFGALTFLAAAAVLLRVWLSSGRFIGGVQVAVSFGLLAFAVILFIARNASL